MSSTHPYYRRRARLPGKPSSAFSACGDYIDLSNAHLPPFHPPAEDAVPEARNLFDARGAALASAVVALDGVGVENGPVRIWPKVPWLPRQLDDPKLGLLFLPQDPWFRARDLLELKFYGDAAPTIYVPLAKCLSALAYLDFFPDRPRTGAGLRSMVSAAVLVANPGWCGSHGPTGEGNYDMSQMHLVAMAYQYFDALSWDAREHLITELLARGAITGRGSDDISYTSDATPPGWYNAGVERVPPFGSWDIGETENHILMIATTRYLTNQLLFQRDPDQHNPDPHNQHDNRRNGGFSITGGVIPSCTSLILSMLHNMLKDDFSEYNAKPYQEETRWALLNLCTYAYDHEVRLGARMVLDYLSAHMAVSSNNLRRLLPFRRRNEDPNNAHDASGFMTVNLLGDQEGGDPMGPYFALQAGNTRAYEASGPWGWGINIAGVVPAATLAMEVLSDYRLPPSIQDLFVNDSHRRFYQRLHRVALGDADYPGGNHNADNMEIYAGSPSYLITAGGEPSGYAIDPTATFLKIAFGGDQDQQLGVAVTTSFIPTGDFASNGVDVIQFGSFYAGGGPGDPLYDGLNYGVAPDFACGHQAYLPGWVTQTRDHYNDRFGEWMFVNRSQNGNGPGFYLAVYRTDAFTVLEAFDTWLHPGIKYDDFQKDVRNRNPSISAVSPDAPSGGWTKEFEYVTSNGDRITATIWDYPTTGSFGAVVQSIDYGAVDPKDALGDAGNVTNRFLNGTVMNSPADAVVEISNPFLNTKITLDMSDPWHPRRTDENGEIEEAGSNHEVWLDFDFVGASEGDVCRPFASIAAAVAAVAEGGLIRVVPGTTTDRSPISGTKYFRLVAPIGGVIIGAWDKNARQPIAGTSDPADPIRKDDVWVQFDFPQSSSGNIPAAQAPYNTLANAEAAVADGGIIRIVPGVTNDRSTIANYKRFTLRAPIGGVTIGARQTPRLLPEVWVNFDWPRVGDGGVCNPFKSIALAVAAVAPGGTINIMPGVTVERSSISGPPPFRIIAPRGGVTLGAYGGRPWNMGQAVGAAAASTK